MPRGFAHDKERYECVTGFGKGDSHTPHDDTTDNDGTRIPAGSATFEAVL